MRRRRKTERKKNDGRESEGGGALGQTLNRRTEKEKMVTDIFNSVKMVKCQVIY